MKKIVIFGSTGLLGSTIEPFLRKLGYKLTAYNRNIGTTLSFYDPSNINRMLDEARPDCVLNLIALTDVDYCELNPNITYLTNVKIVDNIAGWVKKNKNSHLIHVSSDHVYNSFGLNDERSIVLTNYYAYSKYMSELVALSCSSTIIRTNFFGKSNHVKRKTLTDWIYSSVLSQISIKVFNDIYFSPLSLKSLSNIVSMLIELQPKGIYNVGSTGGMSKAEFASIFISSLNRDYIGALSVSSDTSSILKTCRPKGMIMCNQKIEKVLDIKMPTLRDEIFKVSMEYQNDL